MTKQQILLTELGKRMKEHSKNVTSNINIKRNQSKVKNMVTEVKKKNLEIINSTLGDIGREGNGNPLQYSCLENLRDRSLVGCHLWGRTESDMTDVT